MPASSLYAGMTRDRRRRGGAAGAGGFADGADSFTGSEAGLLGGIGGGVSVIVPSTGFTDVGAGGAFGVAGGNFAGAGTELLAGSGGSGSGDFVGECDAF